MLRSAALTAIVACLAYAAHVAGSFAGSRLSNANARANAEIAAELEAWRGGWTAVERRLSHGRSATRRGVRDLTRRLGRMQARIVHLDALGGVLLDASSLTDSELDFTGPPSMGGPEAAWPAEPGGGSRRRGELGETLEHLSRQVEDRWHQLHVLEELLDWRTLSQRVLPDGRPVSSAYISSGFGKRIDPFTGRSAAHEGVDFAGRVGTPVVAVGSGLVTWSGERHGYGRMVEIDHGNAHVTRYAHNSENLVSAGEIVSRGQTIARLGATGRATGPNLHFEVLRDGHAVDPLPYIE